MSSSSRVLITGAGGFVCGSIMQALLQDNWQVIAVDRQFDPAVQAKWVKRWGDNVTFVQTDSRDVPPFEVDAVVHGAAITASPEELGQTPEANLRANIDPLLSILEWADSHNIGHFLSISSSAVYAATEAGAVSETMPTAPMGLYAVAKQTMESLIGTLCSEYERDVATIRLSNIYGPDEQPRSTRPRVSLVAKLIQQATQTGKITVYEDDPARDWTFAPDVGAAVVALLKQATLNHALYNVASEQVLSPLEIAMVIHKLMSQVELEIREGSNPDIPLLTRRGYLSNERLQEETGFTGWTSFEDGIRQALEHQHNEVM
ncbi:MAG: NAD-dependent epimerase/dehydratase family protein [Anaerolineaceae bacterium]|nr:NAD-dependent epimerase/dehydratase family protein [Anaerolineaceae bacterium]